jgi:hypothetical protein
VTQNWFWMLQKVSYSHLRKFCFIIFFIRHQTGQISFFSNFFLFQIIKIMLCCGI